MQNASNVSNNAVALPSRNSAHTSAHSNSVSFVKAQGYRKRLMQLKQSLWL